MAPKRRVVSIGTGATASTRSRGVSNRLDGIPQVLSRGPSFGCVLTARSGGPRRPWVAVCWLSRRDARELALVEQFSSPFCRQTLCICFSLGSPSVSARILGRSSRASSTRCSLLHSQQPPSSWTSSSSGFINPRIPDATSNTVAARSVPQRALAAARKPVTNSVRCQSIGNGSGRSWRTRIPAAPSGRPRSRWRDAWQPPAPVRRGGSRGSSRVSAAGRGTIGVAAAW